MNRIKYYLLLILVLMIGIFLVFILKNGTKEFDSNTTEIPPPSDNVEKTTVEFERGKEIFMEDCRKCHVAKYMRHNYLHDIVEKVGVEYLKLYITKQDSLLNAKDEYALALKNEWGNNGTVHKFKYSDAEFEFLIEYLK
ncbi:c-type cytochrome [Flagellimonas allohymeniacidonis]|uniref:Cytochrome c domain-containing protein n=1 Tax=Flagellimonas allohymeniacidonis TaxID=2517819 RepID=A0A4Q8Q9Q3_9FLAO|nr:c-type cytochrome [Allomuricauda hymeniacidonis]TAI46951.1 hypothetical protein EW142_09635 [Allomuricauda hymeniacidonis]